MRNATVERTTAETAIRLSVTLDSEGRSTIDCPLYFFSHCLESLARFSSIDLSGSLVGDIQVDGHHLVEDTGINLGEALCLALGDKRSIGRTGYAYMPMDESLVRVVIDLSGRPFFVLNGTFSPLLVGDFNPQWVRDFFTAFATHLKAAIHIDVIRGLSDHHTIEAIFKATGLSLKQASALDLSGRSTILSTKEVL